MSAEKSSREEIENVAGTENDEGVVEPSLDEILDPDPENVSEADIAEMKEGYDDLAEHA